MVEQSIAPVPAATQAPPEGERADGRHGHRDLGAFHLYEYLKRPGDPAWDQLPRRAREQMRAGFLVGASSVDLKRVVLREGC